MNKKVKIIETKRGKVSGLFGELLTSTIKVDANGVIIQRYTEVKELKDLLLWEQQTLEFFGSLEIISEETTPDYLMYAGH